MKPFKGKGKSKCCNAPIVREEYENYSYNAPFTCIGYFCDKCKRMQHLPMGMENRRTDKIEPK